MIATAKQSLWTAALALFGLLLSATTSAAASSAGCTAVNGGAFNLSASTFGESATSPSLTFAAGDVLSFTITRTGMSGSDGGLFTLLSPTDTLLLSGGTTASETATHTVTSAALVMSAAVENVGHSITLTATCTPAPPLGPTDSQKLRSLQIQGSKIVAQTSGQAIAGAVGNAIVTALNPQPTPPTGNSPSGGPTGLGGPRAPNADTAAAGPLAVSIQRNGWNAWGDLRVTQSERALNAGGFDGRQVNGTFGLGRIVAPGIVIGGFGGVESFRYDVAALTGRLDGDGVTGGAYLGWQMLSGLRFDLAGAYSRIGYDATAGTASGSFTGHRLLLSSGLTGTHGIGGVVLEPSARLFGVWENQGAYTDSLGVAQDANRFSVGRASFGGRILAPMQFGRLSIAPYAGLYGDYRFSQGDAAVPAGTEILALPDGWSARAVGGLGFNAANGVSLTVGGEWGGIGTDARQRSLNVRGAVPF